MQADWTKLEGGYRDPYDPRPSIEKLKQSPVDSEAWEELWNDLHHQGDVGEASYAAVPLLIEACDNGLRDWNLYALVATIEVERHRVSNPNLPDWLTEAYRNALGRLKTIALEDLATVSDKAVLQSAMAVVALSSGDQELGALLAHLDTDEVSELLDEKLLWNEQYRPDSD